MEHIIEAPSASTPCMISMCRGNGGRIRRESEREKEERTQTHEATRVSPTVSG